MATVFLGKTYNYHAIYFKSTLTRVIQLILKILMYISNNFVCDVLNILGIRNLYYVNN